MIVSVTGLEDNGADDILPGAYIVTLNTINPKGVVGHNWDRTIAEDVAR